MRPLVKKWRRSGIRCILYLDDGIFGSSEKTRTGLARRVVRHDLQKAGFTINVEKSTLHPVQVGVWLGFIINTLDFNLSVPTEKIRKLLRMIPRNLGENTAPHSAREIAKIAGTLISMSPAIGSLTELFTGKMYRFIDMSRTWDKKHTLDAGTISELKFWQ